jgi:hypothetical protein
MPSIWGRRQTVSQDHGPQGTPLEPQPRKAYLTAMIRFFDMADRARLPWRFARETRSISARL